MGAAMIALQADFNHMDPQGRLRLDDLRMHQGTPFAEIAAKRLIQAPHEGSQR